MIGERHASTGDERREGERRSESPLTGTPYVGAEGAAPGAYEEGAYAGGGASAAGLYDGGALGLPPPPLMVVPQLPQNYTRRDRTNKHKRTVTFRSRQIQEDRGQSNSKRCEPRPPKMQLFLEVAQVWR